MKVRTAATFSSLFANTLIGSKAGNIFHSGLRRRTLAIAQCNLAPVALLDAFHNGSMFCTNSRDPS